MNQTLTAPASRAAAVETIDVPVRCPECGSTARVEWRTSQQSTDGSFDLVKIHCPNRHWFLMPDK
jgi:hypothetical protein